MRSGSCEGWAADGGGVEMQFLIGSADYSALLLVLRAHVVKSVVFIVRDDEEGG